MIPRAPDHSGLRTPTVSVVIPTLNEALNIPHVLARLPRWIHEVVLVDGRSSDDTVDVTKTLWPNRHIVTRERRQRTSNLRSFVEERRGSGVTLRLVTQDGRGKGAALRSGFAAATGEIIVMLDADGSTDPTEIPAFVGALLAGAEFAKGSRFLQGGGTADMPLHRRFGNWSFVQMVRLLFGGTYTDLCYGYNAFWAEIVPYLQLNGDGFEIETMMNVRALRVGLKVAEVPSFEAPRINGIGRLRTIPDGWRVLKTIWRERVRPLPISPEILARERISALRPEDYLMSMARSNDVESPLAASAATEEPEEASYEQATAR